MTQRTVTPAVRRLADAQGVNLNSVVGTGAGGRITTNDVRRAAGDQVITAPQAAQLAQMTGVPAEAFRRG